MPPDLRERCGVFGIFGHPEAARLTYFGLLALQHRGQEGAGLAVAGGRRVRVHKGAGLVADVISPAVLGELTGQAAIGHTLYTSGGPADAASVQPLFVRHRQGELAFCYNGALTNAGVLRQRLEERGSIFQTAVDLEVVAHLMAAHHRLSLPEALRRSLDEIEGGFAGAWLTPDALLAARDVHGIRPLCLGRIDWAGAGDGAPAGAMRQAWVVASETCALDTVGATFVREVEPGELLVIDDSGVRSLRHGAAGPPRLCAFEFVYFARPDSDLIGRNVHIARKNLGRELAREHPADADVVIGVPDSSLAAASGYAEEAGLPYEVGLIKNRYVGRTFIRPTQQARELGVFIKLNAVRQVVAGKRVVLVDDSIVRGTTSRRLTNLVRAAGAREVHMRISSPPFRHACPYGIDTADEGELVATGRDLAEMETYVGADSLRFLSLSGMLRALGSEAAVAAHLQGTFDRNGRPFAAGAAAPADAGAGGFCLACFTGYYAVPLAGPGRAAASDGGLETVEVSR